MFGQIKFGKYSHIDTSVNADLKLYADNKFDFYDTLNEGCRVKIHTYGSWELNKDTIIFSWKSTWIERFDSIISSNDPTSKNLQMTFIYDNGKPITNVQVTLSCFFDNYTQKYLTDENGKVNIPQNQNSDKKICPISERILGFTVGNKLSADTYLYSSSSANVLTVVIKQNPKTTYKTESKKYLIKENILINVDPKEFNNYNWGDFKFATTKYGR